MGFRINTNIAAMNAHRNASQTNTMLDKSLQSLSSGLRINNAADDAAGMTIADNLRSQANGLGQAINNANDGVGVVQTADGALAEYISIVDAVRTKSIQSASDGQSSQSREALQADIDRLLEEAQNIAATTSFNGSTLLNGAFENKAFHIGAYSGETVNISIDDAQIAAVSEFALLDATGGATAISAGGTAVAGNTLAATVLINGTTTAITSDAVTFEKDSTSLQNAQKVVDSFNAAANTAGGDINASVIEIGSNTGVYGIRLDAGSDISAVAASTANVGVIGATATAGLTNNLSTADVTTRAAAEKTIIIADYALRDLDKTRSDIGSVQGQLESTIRNISVTQVNVQAAESQIRDVDFAAESANFAKQNILAQSGSYALSQANAVQQNVLRLLQ
mgnify:CR=1 FL=1